MTASERSRKPIRRIRTPHYVSTTQRYRTVICSTVSNYCRNTTSGQFKFYIISSIPSECTRSREKWIHECNKTKSLILTWGTILPKFLHDHNYYIKTDKSITISQQYAYHIGFMKTVQHETDYLKNDSQRKKKNWRMQHVAKNGLETWK